MRLMKFLWLMALITCFACENNVDDIDTVLEEEMEEMEEMEETSAIVLNSFNPDFVQNYGSTISRDILVSVVDLNGNAIEGVTISVANDNETTDDNGIAIVRNASVFERFGYIKASKDGFIHASRSIAPTTGLNQVRIMMLPETVSGSTSSGEIATISNGVGASVLLNGNYVNADGTEYTGSVDVILHHLDPTDATMPDQMPGMLYAQDADGEEQGLITLGMLAVELRGSGGEDLNLMEGTTATITIPVDASLIANAPSTIPLWYFDEVNGVWIEEGEATLEGNNYVGEVTHFSFWNYDIPTDANVICLVLSDEDGNPLANTLITITSTTFGTTSGVTNINGEVCGYMPSGEVLALNVFNDACSSEAIFNTNIGPFNIDTTVAVTITLSGNITAETIIGTLADCDGNVVDNGYAIIDYLSTESSVVVGSDGSFELTIIRCTEDLDFTVTGIDIDGLQQFPVENYTFTTPLTDVGNLMACDELEEFVQYDLDNGAQTLFVTENISANFSEGSGDFPHPSVTISAFDSSSNNGIFMVSRLMPAPYVGVYDFLDFQDPNDLGFDISELFGNMSNNTIQYDLTALGNVGQFIDISFSGSYEDSNGTPHTITGTVHAIRDN